MVRQRQAVLIDPVEPETEMRDEDNSMHTHLIKLVSLSALTAAFSRPAPACRPKNARPATPASKSAATCARSPRRQELHHALHAELHHADGCPRDWLFRIRRLAHRIRHQPRRLQAHERTARRVQEQRRGTGGGLSTHSRPGQSQQAAPGRISQVRFRQGVEKLQARRGRFAQHGYLVAGPVAADQRILPETADQEFYFRGDQHWTPYGAERTAKMVAEKVKRIPGIRRYSRNANSTPTKSGLMGKTGTLQNMAGQLCGTSYAVQYVDQFITEPKGEAGDGDCSATPATRRSPWSAPATAARTTTSPASSKRTSAPTSSTRRSLAAAWKARCSVPGQRSLPDQPAKDVDLGVLAALRLARKRSTAR